MTAGVGGPILQAAADRLAGSPGIFEIVAADPPPRTTHLLHLMTVLFLAQAWAALTCKQQRSAWRAAQASSKPRPQTLSCPATWRRRGRRAHASMP